MATRLHITAKSLAQQFGLPQRTTKVIVDLVALAARERWLEYAEAALGSTRDDYEIALQLPVDRAGFSVIELEDGLADMIEQGADPYDMKPGLLAAATNFTADGARYADVRFEHFDIRGGGNVKQAFGAPYQARKSSARRAPRNLGRKIQVQVRGLRGDARLGPETGGAPLLRARRTRVHAAHKTDIYAGARKVPTAAKRGPANRYELETFRRVSDNSDPQAWWHPGFTGLNLVDRVAEDVHELAREALLEVFDEDELTYRGRKVKI